MICFPETEPLEVGVFRYALLAGRGVESHKGEQVIGRAEGVHPEAGRVSRTAAIACLMNVRTMPVRS